MRRSHRKGEKKDLRQCLREPYREKALQKDVTHMVEKVWVNGSVQAKTVVDDISKGFESAGSAGAEAKK